MEVEICIGSSCHFKGSYQVVRKLEEYIETHSLKNHVILKGSFCLGECTRGVSVRAGGINYSMDEENCVSVLDDIMEVGRAAD